MRYERVFDFSDVIFLREPAQLRPVYDVTAKHALDVIEAIKYELSWCKNTPNKERKKLEAHLARYEAILDRHTSYEPSFYEIPRLSYR